MPKDNEREAPAITMQHVAEMKCLAHEEEVRVLRENGLFAAAEMANILYKGSVAAIKECAGVELALGVADLAGENDG